MEDPVEDFSDGEASQAAPEEEEVETGADGSEAALGIHRFESLRRDGGASPTAAASGATPFAFTQELAAVIGTPQVSGKDSSLHVDLEDTVPAQLDDLLGSMMDELQGPTIPGSIAAPAWAVQGPTIPGSIAAPACQQMDEDATDAQPPEEDEASQACAEGGPPDAYMPPASPVTLLDAVRMNDDGSLLPSGLQFLEEGEAGDEAELERLEAAAGLGQRAPTAGTPRSKAAVVPPAAAAPAGSGPGLAAELSDGSDVEGGAEDLAALAPLGAEPWQEYPQDERELWERARPRALRREAAQVKALKLPAANLNRLMRLNPDMPFRSNEAVDAINYAAVILTQAVVKHAVRQRSGATVSFSDVKKACLGMRELQFLQPLDATLDGSATTVARQELPSAVASAFGAAAAEAVPSAAGASSKPPAKGRATPAPKPEGLSKLFAAFSRSHAVSSAEAPEAAAAVATDVTMTDAAGASTEQAAATGGGEATEQKATFEPFEQEGPEGPAARKEHQQDQTPPRELGAEGAAGKGQKRKAQESAKKSASKGPRRGKAEAKAAAGAEGGGEPAAEGEGAAGKGGKENKEGKEAKATRKQASKDKPPVPSGPGLATFFKKVEAPIVQGTTGA